MRQNASQNMRSPRRLAAKQLLALYLYLASVIHEPQIEAGIEFLSITCACILPLLCRSASRHHAFVFFNAEKGQDTVIAGNLQLRGYQAFSGAEAALQHVDLAVGAVQGLLQLVRPGLLLPALLSLPQLVLCLLHRICQLVKLGG